MTFRGQRGYPESPILVIFYSQWHLQPISLSILPNMVGYASGWGAAVQIEAIMDKIAKVVGKCAVVR